MAAACRPSSVTRAPLPATLVVEAREAMCTALRERLRNLGAHEVTTPVLCEFPDIAPVSQFVAVHPRMGRACLRIAPTEHLKRLLVAGVPAVFELAVNFRGDWPDPTHLTEFTSLEAMFAGAGCAEMRRLTRELVEAAVAAVEPYRVAPSVLAAPQEWRAVPLAEVLRDAYGMERDEMHIPARVLDLHRRLLPEPLPRDVAGAMEDLVEILMADMPGPVFITDFPVYLGGPARACPYDPRFKERSELFVTGVELANMSSSLTDFEALADWHRRGVAVKEGLGIQPNAVDAPLLADLRRLPPSAVTGIGVERLLAMALGVADVRQVSLFPFTPRSVA
jgi:lysyl-tRNA synthetase class II